MNNADAIFSLAAAAFSLWVLGMAILWLGDVLRQRRIDREENSNEDDSGGGSR